MNWSDCPDVERETGKVSGAWVIKGTRVPVDAVIDNGRDGFTPDAIAGMFEGLPISRVRAVLRFAELHAPAP